MPPGVSSDNSAPSDSLSSTIHATLRVAVGTAILVVAALAGVVLYTGLVAAQPSQNVAAPALETMTAVAPGGALDLRDVPSAVAGHYLAAERHYDMFSQVPCFCGCEEMLGHRHLGDCFIRADGQGLEAHALGCGVCLGEAEQVTDLLLSGISDPTEISEAVVADWGDPYDDQG